jgi:anti-sigma factor RsiW
MTEHLSQQVIERYRERTLPPAELIAADDHFAACAACRELLLAGAPVAQIEAASALLRRDLCESLTPEHLSYEQLAAYVDREADAVEREIVESHLAHCDSCTEQFEELRAFAAQLSTYPEAQYAPAAPPALTARLRQRLGLASLSAPTFALGLAGAALLLIAAFPVIRVWRSLQSPAVAPGREIRTAATPPSAATPEASPAPSLAGEASSEPELLALNDGGKRVALTARGKLAGAEGLAYADEQRVVNALKSKSVFVPSLAEVRSAGGARMGGAGERTFRLVGPAGKVIAADRPTLRWQPVEGAESYRVEVSDPNDNYREVATSPALTANEWRLDRPLERGRVYSWQVVALKGGEEVAKAPSPDAPEAKFKVLEGAKFAEIERAKRSYAGQHLVLGVLYAQAGLLDEAERELQALVAANPDSAEAKSLLRSVRAQKR